MYVCVKAHMCHHSNLLTNYCPQFETIIVTERTSPKRTAKHWGLDLLCSQHELLGTFNCQTVVVMTEYEDLQQPHFDLFTPHISATCVHPSDSCSWVQSELERNICLRRAPLLWFHLRMVGSAVGQQLVELILLEDSTGGLLSWTFLCGGAARLPGSKTITINRLNGEENTHSSS